MLLEFAMHFEEAVGIHVSLTSSVGSLTVTSLANDAIAQLELTVAREETAVRDFAERHVGVVQSREITALSEIAGSGLAKVKGLAS